MSKLNFNIAQYDESTGEFMKNIPISAEVFYDFVPYDEHVMDVGYEELVELQNSHGIELPDGDFSYVFEVTRDNWKKPF